MCIHGILLNHAACQTVYFHDPYYRLEFQGEGAILDRCMVGGIDSSKRTRFPVEMEGTDRSGTCCGVLYICSYTR